jgi:hypothetical protein
MGANETRNYPPPLAAGHRLESQSKPTKISAMSALRQPQVRTGSRAPGQTAAGHSKERQGRWSYRPAPRCFCVSVDSKGI